MGKYVKDVMKIFIWFMIGACFFTLCFHFIYKEFQEMHHYELPKGPAMKVIENGSSWFPFDILKGE